MARQFFQRNKERLNVESVKELTDDIFLEHISEMVMLMIYSLEFSKHILSFIYPQINILQYWCAATLSHQTD